MFQELSRITGNQLADKPLVSVLVQVACKLAEGISNQVINEIKLEDEIKLLNLEKRKAKIAKKMKKSKDLERKQIKKLLKKMETKKAIKNKSSDDYELED